MPPSEKPEEADFEEAASKLSDGLESCRSVITNYRAMLRENCDTGLESAGVVQPGAEPPSESSAGES